jgi:hypothetical protein
MSSTLSNGYKLPATGDKGSSFFPDLEFDIQRLNDHTHDGSNSNKISVANLTKLTQTLLAASWVATTGGTYRQLVTLPATGDYDSVIPKFQISGGSEDGSIIYPSVEKVSSTTYYVYINDNTLALKVVYG